MKRKLFKPDLEIPYFQKGVIKSYKGYPEGRFEKEPNYIFTDTIKYSHMARGRSSVKLHFVSTISGNKYEMFVKDAEDILKGTIQVINGTITGEFCFRKAGANYGLAIITD